MPVAIVTGRTAFKNLSQTGSTEAFDRAVSEFRQYIATKKVRDPGNLPFLMVHQGKTRRAILMVHGLSDSPYYMKALAGVFYSEGYNVACVLLPGHGTRAEDLKTVSLRQWKDEVRFGLSVVQELGETVSLAGFSTGGALDIDAIQANYQRYDPIPLKDLFLFSPAIKISGLSAKLACLNGIQPVIGNVHPWAIGDASTPENDPYHYGKMALNGVCQLGELTRQNFAHNPEIMTAIRDHNIGVFTVESGSDDLIAPDSVAKFMRDLPPNVHKEFIFYPKKEAIGHAIVPLSINPRFPELADRLRDFIRE